MRGDQAERVGAERVLRGRVGVSARIGTATRRAGRRRCPGSCRPTGAGPGRAGRCRRRTARAWCCGRPRRACRRRRRCHTGLCLRPPRRPAPAPRGRRRRARRPGAGPAGRGIWTWLDASGGVAVDSVKVRARRGRPCAVGRSEPTACRNVTATGSSDTGPVQLVFDSSTRSGCGNAKAPLRRRPGSVTDSAASPGGRDHVRRSRPPYRCRSRQA